MLKPKKTVKKCLSWLLALVMILSVIPVAVLAAPADLTISSAKELLAFSEKVNGGEDFSGKTVELTADRLLVIGFCRNIRRKQPCNQRTLHFFGLQCGTFRKGKRRYG